MTKTPLACTALFITLFASTIARAQSLSDAEKAAAKEHYEKGRAAYDKGQFDEAVKELKQAYMLSRKPAILFNLAQTYKQIGDAALALHFFQKFVAEADPEDPNRASAQGAIEDLRAEAAKKGLASAAPGEGGKGAEGESATAEKPAGPDFRHVPIGEAPPRRAVDLKIRLGEDATGATSTLFYRGAGEEAFTKAPFTASAVGLTARIPKEAMSSGTSLQYYIETRASDGSLYGSSGTAASPNVIVIDKKAARKDIPELGLDPDEAVSAGKPSRWAPYYRPGKWAAAGAAVATGAVALGFAAWGSRLQSQIQSEARNSSNRNADGLWSDPTKEYTSDLEDKDQQGRRTNLVAWATGLASIAFAGAAGALFYLDHKRMGAERAESSVAVAPVVGPGMAGAAGLFRF